MKIIATLAFLVSFQAFGADINWTEDVDIDLLQTKAGKLAGDQTLVIHYKKCRAERVFEWKDVETKHPKMKEWMVEVVKDMHASGRCG